jgi:hypothetical protein
MKLTVFLLNETIILSISLKIKNNALIKVKNKYDVNNTLQNYHHYL